MSEEWGLWEYDKYDLESMVRRRPTKDGDGFKGYVYQYFPGPDYLNALEERAGLLEYLLRAIDREVAEQDQPPELDLIVMAVNEVRDALKAKDVGQ